MQGSEFLELTERERKDEESEKERNGKKKGGKKKRRREQKLAAIQTLEYTHNTHTDAHTELWTPR